MQLKLCVEEGMEEFVGLPLVLLGEIQMPHLRELVQDLHFAEKAKIMTAYMSVCV